MGNKQSEEYLKLKQSCLPVKSSEVGEIVKKLEDELTASDIKGLGLSAPQIGISKRIAIIRAEECSVNLVNPRITYGGKMAMSEGERCLSVPGVSANIWRYEEVIVVDDLFQAGTVFTGSHAIMAQHEINHLDGILITDISTKANIGRNDPCPCGAVKDGRIVKYKKCHGRRW
jgi:peptide deformylase